MCLVSLKSLLRNGLVQACVLAIIALALAAYPLVGQRGTSHDAVVRSMTVRALGDFQFNPLDPNRSIPKEVQALDGKNIRLSGFMLPLAEVGSKVTKFALVPSLLSCCYGQPPAIQHTVVVTCDPSTPVPYSNGKLWVQGKLHVREAHQDGVLISIFELSAQKVLGTAG